MVLSGRLIFIAVFECTMYEDQRIASETEMEEIAWFLATRKSGRSVGFASAAKFRQMEQEVASSTTSNKDKTESVGPPNSRSVNSSPRGRRKAAPTGG
jgi:hypothetical protein